MLECKGENWPEDDNPQGFLIRIFILQHGKLTEEETHCDPYKKTNEENPR